MNQSELPPTDHVARVLLKRGARDAALNLLRAAIARDPGEMACAALLKAVEARPDSSVYGPDMRLDVSMARTYARRGWIIEAVCLLEGAGLTRIAAGRDLANELYEILGPIPEDAPDDLREADAQVRRGAASVALMTFDEYVATGRPLPAWAERRHRLLSSLLLDSAASARPSANLTAMSPVGSAMQTHLAARDLKGALEVARGYLEDNPHDHDAQAVVVALGRMVEAMARVSAEYNTAAMRTQPMTGINVALFQTRMCNFDVAERMFRKLVIAEPMDELARAHLDDVQTIKKALGAVVSPSMEPPPRMTVDPLRSTAKATTADVLAAEQTRNERAQPEPGPPPRPAPAPVPSAPILEEPTRRVKADELREAVRRSGEPQAPNEPMVPATASQGPHSPQTFEEETREIQVKAPGQKKKPVSSPNLLKKTGRPIAEGWGGADSPKASDWEEVSTEIGDPDKMAELMLKQGYAERALRIYERLAKVYPDRGKYARRAGEIRELVAQGAVPHVKTFPGEDLSTPDEPEDSLDTTLGDHEIVADPRAPAAGAALDALAPPMEDEPDIEVMPALPMTADHAALRRQQEPEEAAAAEAAAADWADDETTIVGDSPEMEHEEHEDDEEEPTTIDVSRDEMKQIVAGLEAADAPAPRDVTVAEAPVDGDVVVRRVIAVR